jgi:beta-galactosidase
VPERAATSDLMRSLKQGAPWLVMEQAAGAVNWRRRNVPKHPGQMRLGTYQALARGADGILFFQWRASKAGAEQFHSAMLPHAGTAARTWREVVELGRELGRLDAVLGARVRAEVAFVFDWESWWGLELAGKPAQDVRLLDQVERWYRAFWERNITVDFVHPEADLSSYRLVVGPNLYLVRDSAAANLERFVAGGGTLVLSFFSGIVDEDDHVRLGGYPAPFRRLLGIVIPEFWPHAEGETHELTIAGRRYACDLWSDWIEVEGAEAVATFADGWLDGRPAVTRNGRAWYVGTALDGAAAAEVVDMLVGGAGVAPTATAPPGVEAVRREADGRSFLFLLNHRAHEARVELDEAYRDLLTDEQHSGAVVLDAFGVAVLDRAESA